MANPFRAVGSKPTLISHRSLSNSHHGIYLQPARWNGTRSAERMPHLERYWGAADPDYCDGEGTESFATLLWRCEAALARLTAMPPASLVYVFGHGQFIQAAHAIVADADLDDRDKMQAFWRNGEPPAISNAQRVSFHWEEGRWQCDNSPVFVT